MPSQIYDPAAGKFTITGRVITERRLHTATLLRDGKVLIAGGSTGRNVLASAELYDPATGKFMPTGSMTAVRHKHAASLLPDGKVLIVGGSDNRDWRGRYISAEIYDPATGKFSATGSMETARFKFSDAVVLLKNGRVLVAGGGIHVETYDPARGIFATATGQMDSDRFSSTATLLANGDVLIIGGYDYEIRTTASAWIYKP